MNTENKNGPKGAGPGLIRVTLTVEGSAPVEYEFRKPFSIGRDQSCEIQIQNPGISRRHAEVVFENGVWLLRDLESANGTFCAGQRITETPLGSSIEIELGLHDAVLSLKHESAGVEEGKTVREKSPSVTEYVQRYFGRHEGQAIGQHTRMIREAFRVVDRKKKLRFAGLLALVLLGTMAIGVYSYWQHHELKRRTELAEQIFYSMKSLELEISRLGARAADRGDQETLNELARFRKERADLARNYDRFLEEIEFYEAEKWNEKDLALLKVTRLFGECELAMPEDFRQKVYEFIEEWKTSRRLEDGVRRAVQKGYVKFLADAILQYDLPPQFLYLGLQESGFNEQAVGPSTRFGIAKGSWQFIPATAMRYGLQVGPLVELPRFDPRDQRHNHEKATQAAARYIRDIYNTEAQASGLLVIASYNWGENNVRPLIRSLPENPRERNFWRLLEKHGKKIPKETYRYVFFIISAAVIGENPKLFGFNFENPLVGAGHAVNPETAPAR